MCKELTPPPCLQVDDLKEKLAAQEIELMQKNEDADALIKRVGVETEKVVPSTCTELYRKCSGHIHNLKSMTVRNPCVCVCR